MSEEQGKKAYILQAGTGRFNLTGNRANFTLTTYPQKLLALSQTLINQGEYSISIVVSHIACEVAVDRVFEAAFKSREIEYLEEAIERLLPGNNLSNPNIRRMYTALTGDEIQAQPFWSRFAESAGRRNKVSHNGKTYDKPEAEASLAVAKEIVAHLKQ
jgi:hypothetical protein